MKLTISRLKEVLKYDPNSGKLIWLISRGRAKAGYIAGRIDQDNYIQIRVDGKDYRAHRLIWLYMTGKWPTHEIDHKDNDRANNKWLNLREATRNQNQANITLTKRNSTGVKGVYWHSKNQCYVASIKPNGRNIYLGSFRELDAAAKAYKIAADIYFGEFARS